MGRVFSYPEVFAGHVPTMEGFASVRDTLRRSIEDCPYISAGLFCGSSVRGDWNVCSDIDALIYYPYDDEAKVARELAAIHGFARQFYVPLQLMPIPTGIAERGLHSIHTYFLNHLQRCAKKGGVVSKDYLHKIYVDWCDPRVVVLEYIKMKMGKLRRRMHEFGGYSHDPDLYDYLGKALSAPVYVARMILECEGLLEEDDTKNTVVEHYCASLSGDTARGNVTQLLQYLYALEQRYSSVLGEALHGELNGEIPYREIIKEIMLSVRFVLMFLEWNAAHLDRKIRTTPFAR